MNVLASAASQIDNIIVYQLLGPAQLAIYSFALLIPDRIRSVFNTITAAALPRLSKSNGGEQVSLMRKVVQLFGVSVVIIACYLGSAPLIFNLLFEGYETSIRLSQIYALSLLVIPAYITLPALFAQAQKKALYTISIGVPILKIVISYYAIISWGILGAIVAKILHQLLHLTFSLFFVFTKSNSHENTPHLQDTQA
jgi:O-antigen/teichoic acid export membrane protein